MLILAVLISEAEPARATNRKTDCYISDKAIIDIRTYRVEMPPMTTKLEMPQEDIDLIALLTMAEAEGESVYGKRLVIDTVLNRMDSVDFPDTPYEVIYQPHQFSSMWDGRVEKCYVMDGICKLVREELQQRTNSEVIYFTAGHYGKYGTPMFQEGNHYFCNGE